MGEVGRVFGEFLRVWEGSVRFGRVLGELGIVSESFVEFWGVCESMEEFYGGFGTV